MVWGSKTQISSAVTVDSTTLQDQTTGVTMNPGESAHVQVDADLGATSKLQVHILTTLDDASEAWDDSAYGAPIVISNTVDPHSVSFVIQGVYRWSLIYNLNTGTDSVTVNAWYRKDGISL